GRAGTSDRVVISEDLWRSAFGANPAVIGSRITVNREPLTVVGILPVDFRFPTAKTELWRPIDYDAPPPDAMARPIALVRTAAGIPEADVLRMATSVAHAADPSTNRLKAFRRPLAGASRDTYLTGAVPLLTGGVLLVFLVLCANVSSLLLERFTSRRREFAMCSALGASRGRPVRLPGDGRGWRPARMGRHHDERRQFTPRGRARRHRDTSGSVGHAGAPGRRNRARVRAARGRDAPRALVRQPGARRSRVELT